MAQIEFTINMNCGVGHDDDADVFVGHCPTLDIYSQGETEEEALEAIKSAVTMHLTTAYDFNRLDKVLRKAGFKALSAGSPINEAVEAECQEYVTVKTLKDAKVKQIPITLPLRLSSHHPQYAGVGQM